jgi:hypothetical protein
MFGIWWVVQRRQALGHLAPEERTREALGDPSSYHGTDHTIPNQEAGHES